MRLKVIFSALILLLGSLGPAVAAGRAREVGVRVTVPPKDSTRTDSTAADSAATTAKLYEYVAFPLLQVVTWPLEKIVVPAIKGLVYPVKPPLRYFLNENVIDKTIQLISFGEKDRVMLYPTMNLAPGTGSSVGLTLRYNSLFGRPTERLVSQGSFYVNGDSRFRTYLTAAQLLGTDFSSKLSMSLVRQKNASVNQPGTAAFWYYSDSSNSFSATVSHPVVEKVALKGGFVFRDNEFGRAPVTHGALVSDFFRNSAGELDTNMRGLNQSFLDRILILGLSRDTRLNENIPLSGSQLDFTYHYHITNAHHDFHGWEGAQTNYFRLGGGTYEISPEEERRSGNGGLGKMLKNIELENLTKQIFNRKVLVTHLYAAQSYELPGNRMPITGLQTLGNDTPMRGYGGSRFRDYTVFSAGAEYRFPVLRLVDGVVFNEYGVFGRSWEKIDYLENIKNSWGFGIRVRRPDIYLFRLQLGFHGAQGIQVNMSVDEPY